MPRRTFFWWAMLLSPLWTGALGCVPCDHPVSDAKDSKVDDRLFGRWEIIPEKGEENQPPDRFTLSAAPGSPTTMRMVPIPIPGEKAQPGDEESMPVYATTVGKLSILSVLTSEPSEPTKYDLVLYRVIDKDNVDFFILDPDVIAAAIKRGELKGTAPDLAKLANPATAVGTALGQITNSPAELRAYLTKHGEQCFDSLDKPIKMKRLPAK
ncbi:MAG: hypothetical protein JSS27_10755 [Planctomycetes bacterium]|nr:hypothetical protein [Planctomycetota bacterium]